MQTESFNPAIGKYFRPNFSVPNDFISSDALQKQSFMGPFSDEEIVSSIRDLRLRNREIVFKKPTNFGR